MNRDPITPTQLPRFLAEAVAAPAADPPVDVLVIGSGAAGLSAALAARAAGARVAVIAKDDPLECNTRYAQGGIAAVLGTDDSFALHAADTLAAGQGLSDPACVAHVVQAAPERIRALIDWGARFDRAGAALDLTREGGHSRRRILHAQGDATGLEIARTLVRRARDDAALAVLPERFLVDLLDDGEGRVCGALLWRAGEGLQRVRAGAVVLATGGAGCLYRETTNPPGATGDGLAVALRAGAVLRDLEFVQFHPTTLYVAGMARMLVTEAVRGEGAHLVNARGERFMPRYHDQAELAPRDAVSLAIVRELRRTRSSHVFLDLSHLDPAAVHARFPGITAACRNFGLDLARDPIPVAPTAHYMVGGVKIDRHGAATLPGLFACGEVASGGLHGANRLGSNSLIESLVTGHDAGGAAAAEAARHPAPPDVAPAAAPAHRAEHFDAEDFTRSLRALMARAVGVERHGAALHEAAATMAFWGRYVLHRRFDGPPEWIAQNQLQVAALVTAAALIREESRGVHFRLDHPQRDDDAWRGHLEISRGAGITYRPLAEPAPADDRGTPADLR